METIIIKFNEEPVTKTSLLLTTYKKNPVLEKIETSHQYKQSLRLKLRPLQFKAEILQSFSRKQELSSKQTTMYRVKCVSDPKYSCKIIENAKTKIYSIIQA